MSIQGQNSKATCSEETSAPPSIALAVMAQHLAMKRTNTPTEFGWEDRRPSRKCCRTCGEYFRIIARIARGEAP